MDILIRFILNILLQLGTGSSVTAKVGYANLGKFNGRHDLLDNNIIASKGDNDVLSYF